MKTDIETAQKMAALIRQGFQKQNLEIEKIYLFGSRARNEGTPESDWDFLVLTKKQFNRKDKIDAIVYSKKMIVSQFHEPTDILVRPVSDLPEIELDTWCVSHAAIKEGFPV